MVVKDNQPTLYQKVKGLLDEAILDGFKGLQHGFYEEVDDGHGRIEKRRVWVTDEVKWLGEELLALWPGLASVAAVESTRRDLSDLGAKVSVEVNSVNRKQSDVVINLPRELAALEPRVRRRRM